MSAEDVAAAHTLTNEKIDELNEYLREAEVPAVERVNPEWSYDSVSDCEQASLWIDECRETVDTLELPMYVDARASSVLHTVLDLLNRLDAARETWLDELTADASA